jgi:hypothetical protein
MGEDGFARDRDPDRRRRKADHVSPILAKAKFGYF